MTNGKPAPRRSTLLTNDVPVWGPSAPAAPQTAPPPSPAPAPVAVAPVSPPASESRRGRVAANEPNHAALARVAVSNAALAWIKAELRTETRMAELRARAEEAIALDVPRDVLLGLVVDACRRHGGSPGMLGDDVLAALGVAPKATEPPQQ
ncbi:hypothetical protein AB0L62_33270 [Nocardia asteroides]|uniref:hypothetical protein n=1 Tax=Nocardia asteroides TaxID=1824 RepID=UPI00341F7188